LDKITIEHGVKFSLRRLSHKYLY